MSFNAIQDTSELAGEMISRKQVYSILRQHGVVCKSEFFIDYQRQVSPRPLENLTKFDAEILFNWLGY